ncbi:MAG: histidinol-phosphate transaminase, partial [Acetivibrio sp.]
IIETREWAKQELKKLGFVFPDAKANFIFASHPNYDAKHIFEELKKNNIYVRYFPGEKTGQYLRITIGTREEMTQLFAFLKKYMK